MNFDLRGVPGRENRVWKTPMFEQYWTVRDQIPEEVILFFRMGDFFEIFGRDALIAAPLLEVQLTARAKDSPDPVPMCGVPVHALESYAEKLLSRGHKVAICEQAKPVGDSENGNTPKLIERKIVRILTPGLPVEPARLEGRKPHWFVVVSLSEKSKFEVWVIDFLAAEVFSGQVEGAEKTLALLKRLDPREIVYSTEIESLDIFNNLKTIFLKKLTPWPRAKASEIFFSYLSFTQRKPIEEIQLKLGSSKSLDLISGFESLESARMPLEVLEQWNVFPQCFDFLDGCGSVLGSRLLRRILSTPLKNPNPIIIRQKFFLKFEGQAQSILEYSKNVYDMERLLGRFRLDIPRIREFIQVTQSMRGIIGGLRLGLALAEIESKNLFAGEKLQQWENHLENVESLLASFEQKVETNVEPGDLSSPEKILKFGFDKEFDRLRNLSQDASDWILEFESKLRSQTQIPSLKVRYNRVFGYFIEVTKTHLDKVPQSFERKQTTVGGERFVCNELKEKESEILTAQAKAEKRAYEILSELKDKLISFESSLKKVFEAFAWVDLAAGVSMALAQKRRTGSWTMPQVEEGPFFIETEDLRHPLVEFQLDGDFVPNSLTLGRSQKRILLLTGPNMAGKSTLMRSAGLGLLLAQCGFRVPAKSFIFAPARGFFSRMGATDRILEGESTFMVEMKETAQIIREAGSDSFVLIDEVGRGTSTQDGLALASAILEHLDRELKCVGIFATHYHELSQLVPKLKSVVNGSMSIREWKGELIFLRKLKLEAAESSFGLYVARLAGIPNGVVNRAARVLESHKTESKDLFSENFHAGFQQVPIESSPTPISQLDKKEVMSETSQKIIRSLETLDCDEVSPKKAWEILDDFARQLKQKPITDLFS